MTYLSATVFSCVTLGNLANISIASLILYPEDRGSTFLRNVSIYLKE